MQSPQSAPPTLVPPANERIMAVLSHLSILVPHLGIILPLILWLANLNNAPYAAYQSKQAFVFHLADIIVTWIIISIAVLMGFLSIGALASGFVEGLVSLGVGFLGVILGLYLLHIGPIIYGIIGAVHVSSGRDFRYWLIGDWVQPD